MIKLAEGQLRHFWPEAKAENALQSVILGWKKKLRFFESDPVANDMNFTLEARKRMKQADKDSIASIGPKIKKYEQWVGRLKPYLVRGVALDEERGFFDGNLFSDHLMIAHTCYRSVPLPMHNVPVVIFLPETPKQVFNNVGRLTGWD